MARRCYTINRRNTSQEVQYPVVILSKGGEETASGFRFSRIGAFSVLFDIVLNAAGTILHQLCVDISSPGGKVITFTTTPVLSDKFDVMLGSCLAVVLQVVAWIKKLKKGMLTNFWWDNFSYDREYLVKTSAFVQEGKISPIIETVYDIDDAVFAFQQLGRFDNVGKNVLRISS
ncbi:hypothetical protein AVEN_222251-1 [Araneus ventricosus]|uniref:Reticulon-4-interacting protein 1, mitochondrial n=1 Tax=Araneus ventricosus TaxID=182803 RepID=A0A4Y2IF91_ARAVE|nr:hypothetical protein AVEN_222251-1 [Araneus ventricosus]